MHQLRKVSTIIWNARAKLRSRFSVSLTLCVCPCIRHRQQCWRRSNHSFSYYGIWASCQFLFVLFWFWFWWRWIVFLRKWRCHWRHRWRTNSFLWLNTVIGHESLETASGTRSETENDKRNKSKQRGKCEIRFISGWTQPFQRRKCRRICPIKCQTASEDVRYELFIGSLTRWGEIQRDFLWLI